MMKSGYFLIACLMLCVASPAWASTYYVSQSGSDANSCAAARSTTPTNQKRNVTAGLGCLTVAGDILYIHAGTYNDIIEEVAFGTTGTSWSAFMTVSAYPGETV